MNKKIKNINDKVSLKIMNFKNNYSYLFKPFIILFIIYIIAFYPIIRANFNYLDDLERVNIGYRGWLGFSRYISEFFSIFIHTGRYLTDVSPLTQIIATVFLTLSSVIVLHLFNKNKKVSFVNIVSVLPIGLCPYFLECISYKYDSPYMALSILVSVFPFLFYKGKKKNVIYPIMVCFGTIMMCLSYQASSGIIPLITLFFGFDLWKNNKIKELLKFLITTASSYLLGLIIFKLFIFSPVDTYISNQILPLKDLIPGFFNNLKIYYTYMISDFRNIWWILIFGLLVSFIISQLEEYKIKKWLHFVIVCTLFFLSLLVVFGSYPALERPSFAPRAMYGVGVLIALLAINISNSKLHISKFFIIGLCYCFFAFSFTYGNCLSEQKRYIDFRVQSVINELNHLDIMNNNNVKKIKINGNAGKASSIKNLPEDYSNIINRLVSQSFGGDWYWNLYYFAYYFNFKNVEIVLDDTLEMPQLYTAIDTMYYTIATNDIDYVLITLK